MVCVGTMDSENHCMLAVFAVDTGSRVAEVLIMLKL